VRKQGKQAVAPPGEHRLHLNMRPPSPATYRAPRISGGSWVLIVVGAVSAALIVLGFLSLLLYALVAGDPG
jgi:hypothetical protein